MLLTEPDSTESSQESLLSADVIGCPFWSSPTTEAGTLPLAEFEALSSDDRVSLTRGRPDDPHLLCFNHCLVDAAQFYNGRVTVDPNKCTGCGRCESGCPVAGSAIHVYPL